MELHMTRTIFFAVLMVISMIPRLAMAGGLLPDRVNKIRIEGRFAVREPRFLFVFSAKPWADDKGVIVGQIAEKSLAELQVSKDFILIRVHGKPVSNKGIVEYFFGPKEDGQQPWNDGREMKWEEWSSLSADIWDHIAILHEGPVATKGPTSVLLNVEVTKGGKSLFDSTIRQTYPNKRRMDLSFRPTELATKKGHQVFNLSTRMAEFRKQHYELGDNPILLTAYDDLGQTERRKYARRGNAWCSEFASYVYRENGLMTPDPNTADVHWKNMREFFESNGIVYPLREVATWPDAKKKSLIKPGSFVSILIGETTHSIIFTGWILESNKPITRYVGISGNNKGMVWPHAPLTLPAAEKLRGKSDKELKDYDRMVYVAVPEMKLRRPRTGVRGNSGNSRYHERAKRVSKKRKFGN
jgi:hypothetical protein